MRARELVDVAPARIKNAALLAFALLLVACAQGGSGAMSGGGKKAASTSADKEFTSGDENKPNADLGSDTQSNSADSPQPSEQDRVIPPEIVSGAYLTCVPTVSLKQGAPAGDAYFGCAAFDDKKRRLPLAGAHPAFKLANLAGLAVDATVVRLPDVDQDITWQVSQAVLSQGLKGEATIRDASGNAVAIRPCHAVWNNGIYVGCF